MSAPNKTKLGEFYLEMKRKEEAALELFRNDPDYKDLIEPAKQSIAALDALIDAFKKAGKA